MKYLLLLVVAALVAACGPVATEPGKPTEEVVSTQTETLIGAWEGCDGRIVSFTQEADQLVGRYKVLAGLASYGFTVEEVGYRVKRTGKGVYEGEVKWKSTGGDVSWRPVNIQVTGDIYKDDGSDKCGQSMTRVTKRSFQ